MFRSLFKRKAKLPTISAERIRKMIDDGVRLQILMPRSSHDLRDRRGMLEEVFARR